MNRAGSLAHFCCMVILLNDAVVNVVHETLRACSAGMNVKTGIIVLYSPVTFFLQLDDPVQKIACSTCSVS